MVVLLLLLLTQIDETAMLMSTPPYSLIGNPGAKSPESKLPATPAPRGALDNEELFIVEGSKNWRSTPGQPEEREK